MYHATMLAVNLSNFFFLFPVCVVDEEDDDDDESDVSQDSHE